MDNYYITYHIDVEALHQDPLLELLNSYRLDILTKYKQLTDIYYSIEDGILFQHCTTIDNRSLKKPFPMLHLNDDGFGKAILADITYDLLNDYDVFRDYRHYTGTTYKTIRQGEHGDLIGEVDGFFDTIDKLLLEMLGLD